MTEEQRHAIEWAIGMASQHNIHKEPLRALLAAGASEGQSPVADAAGAKPIYQECINENGLWMDTSEQTYTDILNGKLSSKGVRIVCAAPPAPSSDTADLQALRDDIIAIDTWYRGSPSYEHDAGWFKDRVLRAIDERIEELEAELYEGKDE